MNHAYTQITQSFRVLFKEKIHFSFLRQNVAHDFPFLIRERKESIP